MVNRKSLDPGLQSTCSLSGLWRWSVIITQGKDAPAVVGVIQVTGEHIRPGWLLNLVVDSRWRRRDVDKSVAGRGKNLFRGFYTNYRHLQPLPSKHVQYWIWNILKLFLDYMKIIQKSEPAALQWSRVGFNIMVKTRRKLYKKKHSCSISSCLINTSQ